MTMGGGRRRRFLGDDDGRFTVAAVAGVLEADGLFVV